MRQCADFRRILGDEAGQLLFRRFVFHNAGSSTVSRLFIKVCDLSSYSFYDYRLDQFTELSKNNGQFPFLVQCNNHPCRIQEPSGPQPIFRQLAARVAITPLESLAEVLGVTPGVLKKAPYVPERRAGKDAFPINQSAHAPAAVLGRRYEDVSSAEVAVNQARDAIEHTQTAGVRLQPAPHPIGQLRAEPFARKATQ